MDRQCEPPLLWELIQVVTVAGPGPSCLTQHGGRTAYARACMYARFPVHSLPPGACAVLTASSSSLQPVTTRLTCPHPHCFCLSLPPQLDLPPQAVPRKQPKGAKIRFNVADKVLPAVAPLISPCVPPRTLLFTLVQILSLSLFYLIYLFLGCFNLPPTCTTQPPDVLVHLPSAQPH